MTVLNMNHEPGRNKRLTDCISFYIVIYMFVARFKTCTLHSMVHYNFCWSKQN